MLRSLLAKFKRVPSPHDNKEEKKKVIKEWISKIGINLHDIESLLFWKDPRVSLAIFIIATGFFWKFISYKLQKFGLLVIAVALPCSFLETRSYIWRYCSENFQLRVNQEKRKLGFDCNDVYEFVADCWLKFDQHYEYLLSLKHSSVVKFYLVISSYITLFVILITYFPLAGMLYLAGTLLYFYPVLTYLDFFNVFATRVRKLTRPFILHWSHSQTKRNRNRKRNPLRHTRHQPDSDIENEEFLPLHDKECEKVLEEEIYRKSSSDNGDFDEFQLRGEFHKRSEDHSSDYDEDSFLPSYDYGVSEMPSLSHFDSMMEPLEDEFHAGLDFRNITATSFNNTTHSNFGIPSHIGDEDLTSDDIDDIPLEETEDNSHRKVSDDRLFHLRYDAKQKQRQEDINYYNDIEFDVDQEFEFLDRTELDDVTDEEIMEQNVGNHSHSKNVVPSGSNVLGY